MWVVRSDKDGDGWTKMGTNPDNPNGELIPVKRYAEMRTAATRRSIRLAEKIEQRVLDSDQMNNQVDDVVADPDSDDNPPAFTSEADGQSLRESVERRQPRTARVSALS